MDKVKIVHFHNFTDKEFVGFWNSVPQPIQPGQTVPMEEWRAKHYAKHLINSVVQSLPNGATLTSPKNPLEIPIWKEYLSKCIIDTDSKTVASSNATVEILQQTNSNSVTPTEPSLSGVKCDQCEYVAKNNVGLGAHQRARHPKT